MFNHVFPAAEHPYWDSSYCSGFFFVFFTTVPVLDLRCTVGVVDLLRVCVSSQGSLLRLHSSNPS